MRHKLLFRVRDPESAGRAVENAHILHIESKLRIAEVTFR